MLYIALLQIYFFSFLLILTYLFNFYLSLYTMNSYDLLYYTYLFSPSWYLPPIIVLSSLSYLIFPLLCFNYIIQQISPAKILLSTVSSPRFFPKNSTNVSSPSTPPTPNSANRALHRRYTGLCPIFLPLRGPPPTPLVFTLNSFVAALRGRIYGPAPYPSSLQTGIRLSLSLPQILRTLTLTCRLSCSWLRLPPLSSARGHPIG